MSATLDLKANNCVHSKVFLGSLGMCRRKPRLSRSTARWWETERGRFRESSTRYKRYRADPVSFLKFCLVRRSSCRIPTAPSAVRLCQRTQLRRRTRTARIAHSKLPRRFRILCLCPRLPHLLRPTALRERAWRQLRVPGRSPLWSTRTRRPRLTVSVRLSFPALCSSCVVSDNLCLSNQQTI